MAIPDIPSPLSRYEPRPDLLRGRCILVTGAADGVGRVVALACARVGATVLALDRKQRKLETMLFDFRLCVV